MKYYILLNPIPNEAQGVSQFFAQPRTFNREDVLAEINKQGVVRAFASEQDARYYTRTLKMKLAMPPKASGEVALILTVDLSVKIDAAIKQENLIVFNPDNDPKDPYPTTIEFQYQEINVNRIPKNALISAKFSDRNLTVDLKEPVSLLDTIKNIFSKKAS